MEKTVMKKDLIFTPAILLIGVLLFLLRATGMTAHIAISVVGLLVLIAYAVLTKKDWKIPALEIIHRVFYAVALISGIALKAHCTFVAMPIIHRVAATLFTVLFAVTEIHKILKLLKK